MKHLLWISLLAMLSRCITVSANTVDMNFKGTLIEPPLCQINAGQDIIVYFGKIGINKLDGNNYRKDIGFPLDCVSSPPWSLTMTLNSNKIALFSPGTIQSSINGMGIKIFVDGEPVIFSKDIIINPEKIPKLEAVPISKKGVTLIEGKFTASATLTLQYQ